MKRHLLIDIGAARTRIVCVGAAAPWNEIVLGRRGITVDTALRFAQFFGTTPELWQNLQTQYELDVAKRSIWAKIKKTVVPYGKVAVF